MVSDVGDCLDGGGVAEFLSEPTDGDGDGVREGVGVFVPCLFEEVFCAEGGGVGPHERFEDREFFGREVEAASLPGGGVVEGSSSIPAAR